MWTHPANTSVPRGVSGCFRGASLGPTFRVSRCRVAELWRGRSSNELEYCLLGGRSLRVGHQIKGCPAFITTASVQVCNWTEQRAGTLTLQEAWSDHPDIYRCVTAISHQGRFTSSYLMKSPKTICRWLKLLLFQTPKFWVRLFPDESHTKWLGDLALYSSLFSQKRRFR